MDIDYKKLGALVKAKRDEVGLSLRETAAQSGVAASTLSRTERVVGCVDAEQVSRLAQWLEVDLETLTKGQARETREGIRSPLNRPMPEIVDGFIQRDRTLSADAKSALSQIFTIAYNQSVKHGTTSRRQQSPAGA